MIGIVYSNTDNYHKEEIDINIRSKDMNSKLVKELIGLMKKTGEEYGNKDNRFIINSHGITGSEYYVPENNAKRVLEIMTELALMDFE